MRIDLDGSDLDRLVAALHEVPAGAHRNFRKATQVSAHHIRDGARQAASGIAHAPHYPRSITYDTKDLGEGVGVTAEIGPELERPQGPLGGILETGTVNNAPHAHLGPALDRFTPDFEKGLEIAAAQALEQL